MTHTKKWIIMLVLTIILVPITSVSADTYVAKENLIIDLKYYEFFKYQFGEDNNYKFFAYDCTRSGTSYTSTCYYGIDNDNNYIKISYDDSSELTITKGIDESFSVTGNNIIEVKPSIDSQLLYLLSFAFVLIVVLMLFQL